MKQQVKNEMTALFVFHKGHLESDGGGVQLCSREYFETLKAAGFTLKPIEVPYDKSLLVRVRRRIWPNPYQNVFDMSATIDILKAAIAEPIQYIFLNQRSLGSLAKPLKRLIAPTHKIVLLSHGLESVDYFHKIRISSTRAFARTSKFQTFMLAHQLVQESCQNEYLDHIFCLSPFEVEIERWLGARDVTYIPRTIFTQPLDWRPHPGRFGFVGRIDHPPNAEGLILFLEELQKLATSDIHVRIIGGPQAAGKAIANRFPIAEYLGNLSDEDLEQEARTWNCFVHPLFCYSRGCSTKIAVAIGWEIPIITTTMGCRGYSWKDGCMPIANTPESLTKLALQLIENGKAQEVRREISKIRRLSPTTVQIADLIRSALFAGQEVSFPISRESKMHEENQGKMS